MAIQIIDLSPIRAIDFTKPNDAFLIQSCNYECNKYIKFKNLNYGIVKIFRKLYQLYFAEFFCRRTRKKAHYESIRLYFNQYGIQLEDVTFKESFPCHTFPYRRDPRSNGGLYRTIIADILLKLLKKFYNGDITPNDIEYNIIKSGLPKIKVKMKPELFYKAALVD